MSFAPGTRIGVYEIESAIGAGGMGAVYRALDTRLGRRVAIKVLPASLAGDPDRVARFEREAQVLAALNHPHIAQIYGVEDGPAKAGPYEGQATKAGPYEGQASRAREGHDEGQAIRALVMELVDGSTLADRIREGPLAVDEALVIARQVADALQAAHDKGIVHRDLKPSNIALTADGTVKVLDFGLAKLVASPGEHAVSDPNLTASPTLASPAAMTGAGMILGTAAYMSPEQAKGRVADKRSDVWAFGCVLYEVLTGRRAFPGDDVSETLASILAREPEWRALPPQVTPPVRTLIERCLVKDARLRFADMSVVQYLLESRPETPLTSPGIAPARRTTRERIAWGAAAIAAVAAAALAAIHSREAPPEIAPTVRFSVAPPPGTSIGTGVVSGGGILSPDGRRIVFPAAPRSTGSTRLAVRSFDEDQPRELAGTDSAISPFWSPDSRFVAFLAGGRLQRIDVTGGPPQVICDATSLSGGTWNADDIIVFAPGNGPLLRVPARGGTPTPVTTLDKSRNESSHRHPWFLPDGVHFLYTITAPNPEIHVGSLADISLKTRIGESDTNAMYANGYLLFVRQSTLLARRFDVDSLATSGEAQVVARDVSNAQATAFGDFSVSTTSVLSYRASSVATPTQLQWVDRSGKLLERVGEPSDQTELQLSPDGKRLAVSVFDPAKRSRDIWIHDLTRGIRTRFTFGAADEWASAWSPDGRRLAFSGNQSGILDLYEKTADGAGSETRLSETGGNNKYVMGWSPDGRQLLYATGRTRSQTGNDIWVMTKPASGAPASGGGTAKVVVQSQFNDSIGSLSHDGRWLAYTSDESGRYEIHVVPFPGPGGGKWQVSSGGGGLPKWSGDDREIFFVEGGKRLMAASVGGRGAAFEVGAVRPLFEARFRTENYLGYGVGAVYDVASDGTRFLVNVVASDQPAETPITVVTNWTTLLR
jgi:serine/threonine protein kinase/Tol biopolymer transport system component